MSSKRRIAGSVEGFDMPNDLQLNRFQITHVDWLVAQNTLSNLRRQVFIIEQGVSQEEEWDGQDATAQHWLATDATGKAIGTARLLPSGQIGRMAVLSDYRGTGTGAALLQAAVNHARDTGFSTVFLNAQSHALGFYQRAGFTADGAEFMEAGIPHYHMTQLLITTENSPVRTIEAPDIALLEFDTLEADWSADGAIITAVRDLVLGQELGQALDQELSQELGLPADRLSDDTDKTSLHWHAKNSSGETIGVVRMDLKGNISRLAVLPEHRNQGAGRALLDAAVARATRYGLPAAQLAGLQNLNRLFIHSGFTPIGESFMVHGHPHQIYRKDLTGNNIERQRQALSISDDDDGVAGHTDKLRQDHQLLRLRREADFRQVILHMCQQAQQSIRIWSPMLDHKLFHSDDLSECISALARRNRYTKIEILLYDSHRAVKTGHALVDISRKLSSSISIKIVDPELRHLNDEFVLVDNAGVIYRSDFEQYEGFANFRDITENSRLGRQFKSAWETGLHDPNLRQLKI